MSKIASLLMSLVCIGVGACTFDPIDTPPGTSSSSGGPEPKPQVDYIEIRLDADQPEESPVVSGGKGRTVKLVLENMSPHQLCVPNLKLHKTSTRLGDITQVMIVQGSGLSQADDPSPKPMPVPFTDVDVTASITPTGPCLEPGEMAHVATEVMFGTIGALDVISPRSGDVASFDVVGADVVSFIETEARARLADDGEIVDSLPSVSHVLRKGFPSIFPVTLDPAIQPEGNYEVVKLSVQTFPKGGATGIDGFGLLIPSDVLGQPVDLVVNGLSVPATFDRSAAGEGMDHFSILLEDEMVVEPSTPAFVSLRWSEAVSFPLVFDIRDVDVTSQIDCNAGNLMGTQGSALIWTDFSADPHMTCAQGSSSADYIGDHGIRFQPAPH